MRRLRLQQPGGSPHSPAGWEPERRVRDRGGERPAAREAGRRQRLCRCCLGLKILQVRVL